MRIILFTGKGGVGKTSLSAATALMAAEQGHKTIVMSTDAAHSLSDIFEEPLSGTARRIHPNLDALEVDPEHEMQENWEHIRDFFSHFFSFHGLDELISEELSVLPGMEEIFSLMLIAQFEKKGLYDCCIVDCAPTGSTLRLLSLPEILNWYIKNIFPIQKAFWGVARPVAGKMTAMPLPSDEFFNSIKKFYHSVSEMRDIMLRDSTTIRLVLNPEKIVVREVQRAYTYFCLYGFNVDSVMINRIYPVIIKDHYFDTWKKLQKEYMDIVMESFHPLPAFEIPLLDREIVGIPLLLSLARKTYEDKDPIEVFHRGSSFRLRKKGAHYLLAISLPFVPREETELMHKGDELVVKAGSFKRIILLPESLRGTEVVRAKMEEGELRIMFKKNREKGEEQNGKEKE